MAKGVSIPTLFIVLSFILRVVNISAFLGRGTRNQLQPKTSTRLLVANDIQTMQKQYPRPLHSGGYSLPPLVEDLLPIATTSPTVSTSYDASPSTISQTNLLLIMPPDMESLWEWYAYTKRLSDSDPSWGRVWPTALSLSRFILRSLNGDESDDDLVKRAVDALKNDCHVVELGCGLGVAGLSFAASINNSSVQRTITFLDREPYALHCVMSSASMNKMKSAPIVPVDGNKGKETTPPVTIRAAIDDWTLPASSDSNSTDNSNSQIKNMCYQDLHLDSLGFANQNTIILASDILYEPSSMKSLATKLQSLLHPINGGYALLADPEKERTSGCREAFVRSVKELGGEVVIVPLPVPQSIVGNTSPLLIGADVDIDGNLAKTVLIAVRFHGEKSES